MSPFTSLLIMKLAGRPRFGMTAEIIHIGRRSGRRYTTPVAARRAGGVIVIPMTFGARSDWSRNVRATGGCSIRLRGGAAGPVRVPSRRKAQPDR